MIINQAKKLTYNNKIYKSTNPSKTVWDITKMETGKANTKKKKKNNILDKLQFGEKQISDCKEIAEILNKHFTSIGETIAAKNNYN